MFTVKHWLSKRWKTYIKPLVIDSLIKDIFYIEHLIQRKHIETHWTHWTEPNWNITKYNTLIWILSF